MVKCRGDEKKMPSALFKRVLVILALAIEMATTWAKDGVQTPPLAYEARELTFGPSHHFYGYIGHVGNSPYNRQGKWLVALRTTFQDRMPTPDDAADIVLLDAARVYLPTKPDPPRGWNPQQGA